MPAPGKKPQNLMRTLRELMSYLGRHKLLFLAVAVLVTISATANLLGTYMIRPVVDALSQGNIEGFVASIALTAAIYVVGVLSAFGYTQAMVHAAQKVLVDIRRDLFAHIQTLPLRYFDTRSRGDIMSYFTNDVDTVAEAMNNSFAMVIQSFIQIVGTLAMIFILNWQLSLVVVVGYIVMFAYIRFSTNRSRGYYQRQQTELGELDGYIEEMVTGQKVVKVFNHERANVEEFRARNERLRVAGTSAQAYAASMVPAVVSISYVNYAIVGRARRLDGHHRGDGRGCARKLPGVCAADGHAHQPVYAAVQLLALGPCRCGARVLGHARASRGGRGTRAACADGARRVGVADPRRLRRGCVGLARARGG